LEAALASYDSTTAQHSNRVAVSAATMGEAWGLSERERLVLGWAGALHDVGKIAVSEAVLAKKGPLTAMEWAMVKRHSEVGAQLLLAIHEDLDPVASAVRSHHERWDGAGYPTGLAGLGIPLLGRILAVVDAYDAMTAGRPYHRAKSPQEALMELSDHAGTQFDPELAGLFIQLHREHRIG
jgi:putative nucleotidyltransferase with HDIG domain